MLSDEIRHALRFPIHSRPRDSYTQVDREQKIQAAIKNYWEVLLQAEAYSYRRHMHTASEETCYELLCEQCLLDTLNRMPSCPDTGSLNCTCQGDFGNTQHSPYSFALGISPLPPNFFKTQL